MARFRIASNRAIGTQISEGIFFKLKPIVDIEKPIVLKPSFEVQSINQLFCTTSSEDVNVGVSIVKSLISLKLPVPRL